MQQLLTAEEWVQHPEADRYELIDGVLKAARSSGGRGGVQHPAAARAELLCRAALDAAGSRNGTASHGRSPRPFWRPCISDSDPVKTESVMKALLQLKK